jgi:hypothetical protein
LRVLVGYARVSTPEQDLALQLDALHSAGCTKLFEKASGAQRERPALQAALDYMRQGDTLGPCASAAICCTTGQNTGAGSGSRYDNDGPWAICSLGPTLLGEITASRPNLVGKDHRGHRDLPRSQVKRCNSTLAEHPDDRLIATQWRASRLVAIVAPYGFLSRFSTITEDTNPDWAVLFALPSAHWTLVAELQ